jgi:glycosyltransferase involved in cell wall biosynthesis
MLKIDIILLTYNSAEPCLSECLTSIGISSKAANIEPHLIVVDKDSSDDTIDIIKEHGDLNPIFIMDKTGTRATARQKGIEEVESKFFVFIDSDVIIPENWFSKMLELMDDPRVGAIWGMAKSMRERDLIQISARAKISDKNPEDLILEHGIKRGMTHDTIIRKKAIKGIKIPPELHSYEDHYIRLYVEKQGYQWKSVKDPFCYHFPHTIDQGKNSELAFYFGWKLGVYSGIRWYLYTTLIFPIKIIYYLLFTRNFKVLQREFRRYYHFHIAMLRLFKEYLCGEYNYF